jgi:hypothetical protein
VSHRSTLLFRLAVSFPFKISLQVHGFCLKPPTAW